MSFRNAIRLLITKFSLVWGTLLYMLCVTAALVGACVALWYPIFRGIVGAGVFVGMGASFDLFFRGETTLSALVASLGEGWGDIVAAVLDAPWTIAATLFVLFVVGRILYGLKDVALCICVNYEMTANVSYPFASALFRNKWLSFRFVLARTLFTLPFDALLALTVWGAAKGLSAIGWIAVVPFAALLLYVVLVSLKNLLFALWTPYLVADGKRMFAAMRSGMRLGLKFASRTYSLMVVTRVLEIVLNVFSALFTMGVGLLVTVPMCMVFQQTLDVVILYTHTGRRYYLDPSTVFQPPAHLYRAATERHMEDVGPVAELNSDFDERLPAPPPAPPAPPAPAETPAAKPRKSAKPPKERAKPRERSASAKPKKSGRS